MTVEPTPEFDLLLNHSQFREQGNQASQSKREEFASFFENKIMTVNHITNQKSTGAPW